MLVKQLQSVRYTNPHTSNTDTLCSLPHTHNYAFNKHTRTCHVLLVFIECKPLRLDMLAKQISAGLALHKQAPAPVKPTKVICVRLICPMQLNLPILLMRHGHCSVGAWSPPTKFCAPYGRHWTAAAPIA
jgi:hypothetical protein